MLYLADTQAFIFHLTAQTRRLGRTAVRVFQRAERGLDEVRLSTVSLYEIALLLERDRLRTKATWQSWLSAAQNTRGFAIEPLLVSDIEEARTLSILVDPFDRLIAGTAIRLDAALLTSDERITNSGLVKVVWS